jgi:plasmid maintenance system antidote protein VapI
MALRLSKFFSTNIKMWINLQAQYDAWLIKKRANKIKVKPFDKAA